MSKQKKANTKLNFIHGLIAGFLVMLLVGLFVTKINSLSGSTQPTEKEVKEKDYSYRSIQSLKKPTPMNEDTQVIRASTLAYAQIPLNWYVYNQNSEFTTFSNRPLRENVMINTLTATAIDCSAIVNDPAKDTDQSNFYDLNNTNQWFGGKSGQLGGGGTGNFTREEVTINGKKAILQTDTWLTATEGDAPKETKKYNFYIGESNKVVSVNCSYKPSNTNATNVIKDLVNTLVIAD